MDRLAELEKAIDAAQDIRVLQRLNVAWRKELNRLEREKHDNHRD
jgi:3'-phosphoadenosine 5'-phosphosulfate sulfotransferase